MKKFSNDNGSWYSHRLDDGSWCNGFKVNPPKQAKTAPSQSPSAGAQIMESLNRIEGKLDAVLGNKHE